MKLLSIIFPLLFITACNKRCVAPVTHSVHVTVIDDLTDTFALHPSPAPIIAAYNFNVDPNQAATFRLTLLTDKLLNPVQDISVSDGITTEKQNVNEDIEYRERLVYSFLGSVRKAVTDFHEQYAPAGGTLKHSECFATISAELEYLANDNSFQRYLIIFSDLAENNDDFSCYTRKGQKLLASNTNKVAKLLQKRHPLPASLAGVTVFFVYQPRTHEEDKRFALMVGIYTKLLRARGARVVIQANNSNFQL
jgi:hypothetical protein